MKDQRKAPGDVGASARGTHKARQNTGCNGTAAPRRQRLALLRARHRALKVGAARACLDALRPASVNPSHPLE